MYLRSLLHPSQLYLSNKRLLSSIAIGLILCFAAPTSASPGVGDNALPGVIRTASALAIEQGPIVALSSSYGFTGAILKQDDSHHRGSARLVLGYGLSPDLALALRLDGRYDKHFGNTGSDHGWVGDPQVFGRYRQSITPSLHLGVQLGMWAPGSNAPSILIKALSAELVTSLTWTNTKNTLQISANAGYRLDRSGASIKEPEKLSLADRSYLGISDSNAALFALGLHYKRNTTEILAEWSLDYLHGSKAPRFRSSPMRLGLGLRHPLNDTIHLFAQGEYRISTFDTKTAPSILVPFEPTVRILAGLQIRFGEMPSDTPKIVEKEIPPEKPLPPPTSNVTGRVQHENAPVVDATVMLVDAQGNQHDTQSGEDGSFVFEDMPLGQTKIIISAKGFDPKKSTLELKEEGSVSLTFSLSPILPPGQIRGMIRSFRGKGLKAELLIEPGGLLIQTQSDGSFQIDLPPGTYQVQVRSQTYKAQDLEISVEENGVTIMNVDMRR